MKRILAALLALSLSLSVAGCAPAEREPDYLAIEEGTVLSRSEPELFVEETEYPSPLEVNVLGNHVESASALTNGESPVPVQSAAAKEDYIAGTETVASARKVIPMQDEVRAMWFSFYDLAPMLKGRSEAQFRSSITEAFENCRDLGLNTMIVHVRSHGDAFYESAYFPWTRWLDAGDVEGNNPGYDPLAIMVDVAHSMNLRIEAWINPYRVRTDKNELDSSNPAAQWLAEGSDNVVRYDGGIYYNPARKEAQKLIIDGVVEVVKNYEVDGVHFDDYFYPGPDDAFDQQAYDDYRAAGGAKNRADWRRANVDTLVKAVYSAIKGVNKNVVFGISPQGNRSNNYNQQYSDVDKWVSNPGYVDYICPQIYWGFNNTAAPFRQVAREWSACVTEPSVKLIIGLAAYKIGGSEADFKNNTDNMMNQVVYSRELANYDGFMLFRYDSLFNPEAGVRSHAKNELANLGSVLD